MKICHTVANSNYRLERQLATLAAIVASSCQTVSISIQRTVVTVVRRRPDGGCTCELAILRHTKVLSPKLVTCTAQEGVFRVPVQ